MDTDKKTISQHALHSPKGGSRNKSRASSFASFICTTMAKVRAFPAKTWPRELFNREWTRIDAKPSNRFSGHLFIRVHLRPFAVESSGFELFTGIAALPRWVHPRPSVVALLLGCGFAALCSSVVPTEWLRLRPPSTSP
jgi:hypothetical protein